MRVYLPATDEMMEYPAFVLRKRGENVSMPLEGVTTETLIEHGAYPLMEGPQPTPQVWQWVSSDGVEEGDGFYTTKYKLVPEFDTQEEEDAYAAEYTANQLRLQTPEKISDRQFFTALWKEGLITFEEALAATAVGTIPSTLQNFVDMLAQLDPTGAQEATILLSGATEFRRDSYLVPVFGYMYGMTDAQIDALWRLGATL